MFERLVLLVIPFIYLHVFMVGFFVGEVTGCALFVSLRQTYLAVCPFKTRSFSFSHCRFITEVSERTQDVHEEEDPGARARARARGAGRTPTSPARGRGVGVCGPGRGTGNESICSSN